VILDEATISEELRIATRDIVATGDLPGLVRSGGGRRLRRRWIAATSATVILVAGIATGVVALATQADHAVPDGSGGHRPGSARSCEGTGGGKASPVAYPRLLMLPPDQAVTYAFTNSGGAPRCAYFPHVALTLLQQKGDAITRGVTVEGPDAPSVAEDGDAGQFSSAVTIAHPTVDGQTASVFYIRANESANVFWSGGAEDQWHVTASGVGLAALKRLLHHIRFDATSRTATLPNAAARGWTVAPAAPDYAGKPRGVFYALWHEDGSKAALWVAPGPDRVDQWAAAARHSHLVTVRGRPGTFRILGKGYAVMRWQVGRRLTAYLSVTHSSPSAVQQVAASLRPISPTDPRLFRPK
jgi:hypothetical protein